MLRLMKKMDSSKVVVKHVDKKGKKCVLLAQLHMCLATGLGHVKVACVYVAVLLQLRTGSVKLKATQTYPARFGYKVASLHIEAVLLTSLVFALHHMHSCPTSTTCSVAGQAVRENAFLPLLAPRENAWLGEKALWTSDPWNDAQLAPVRAFLLAEVSRGSFVPSSDLPPL
jgi:hypothetical protein